MKFFIYCMFVLSSFSIFGQNPSIEQKDIFLVADMASGVPISSFDSLKGSYISERYDLDSVSWNNPFFLAVSGDTTFLIFNDVLSDGTEIVAFYTFYTSFDVQGTVRCSQAYLFSKQGDRINLIEAINGLRQSLTRYSNGIFIERRSYCQAEKPLPW